MIARARQLGAAFLTPAALVAWLAALLFGCLHIVAARQGWLIHGLPPIGTATPLWAGMFMIGWALMTAAMNLPSLQTLLEALRRVGGAGVALMGAVAALGVWMLVGALIWVLLLASAPLLQALPPGGIERFAGLALLAAATYQISPLARACQEQCARPLRMIARSWGQGASRLSDAARIGRDHGWNCVGCCLPMIVAMFVVGMSDVRWLAAFALVMALQKTPRAGRALGPVLAAATGAAGIATLVGWWTPELLSMRALCARPL